MAAYVLAQSGGRGWEPNGRECHSKYWHVLHAKVRGTLTLLLPSKGASCIGHEGETLCTFCVVSCGCSEPPHSPDASECRRTFGDMWPWNQQEKNVGPTDSFEKCGIGFFAFQSARLNSGLVGISVQPPGETLQEFFYFEANGFVQKPREIILLSFLCCLSQGAIIRAVMMDYARHLDFPSALSPPYPSTVVSSKKKNRSN